jgi:thiosulfate/3-mercaptopyruvate sulfurtransferase
MKDQDIAAKQYAHPEALVSTDWLAGHLSDSSVRILESDEDVCSTKWDTFRAH